MAGVGLRRVARMKAQGHHGLLHAKKAATLKIVTGAIATAAPVGTTGYNVYDGKSYHCTVAAGTWVETSATP